MDVVTTQVPAWKEAFLWSEVQPVSGLVGACRTDLWLFTATLDLTPEQECKEVASSSTDDAQLRPRAWFSDHLAPKRSKKSIPCWMMKHFMFQEMLFA
jgi:hypothetical protein